MLTHAQRKFDEDYKVLRHLYITCQFKGKERVILWLKRTAWQVVKDSEEEINSEKFQKSFSSQSYAEREYMKNIHEKEPYDGEQ